MTSSEFTLDFFSLHGEARHRDGRQHGPRARVRARAREGRCGRVRAEPARRRRRHGGADRGRGSPPRVDAGRHHRARRAEAGRRRVRGAARLGRHPDQQRGHRPLGDVLEYGRPIWDATVAVNLTAAFEMSYEAAQRMVPQRSGKIINICSVFSFLGGQQAPAYAATKHGIAGLTKTYCDELAQHNIQVNGIAPGYYATELTAATRSDPVLESARARSHPHRPLGRAARPDGRGRLPREPRLGLRQRAHPLGRRRLPRPLGRGGTPCGPYLIGIDGGTQSTKVVVVDAEGQVVAEGRSRCAR